MSDPNRTSTDSVNPSSRLAINEPEVVAKVLDGEAVIINLTTGVYCGLNFTGTFIWERIVEGDSIREAAEAVSAHYSVPPESASADTLRLTRELLDAGLVRLNLESARSRIMTRKVEASANPYEDPRLDVFTDMSELLALDPPMPGFLGTWDDPGGNDS